ncbi:MAG: UvrD-helicase domain-containing protein [Defluviitaleaceae bacterium]|nr:UvrD-helicase domain-containing protein [Defluviitaleaceae bacterium]MCL2240175.1 UvrD-helicase domain-containing protein [Defluviitaleaceae bacterium]
MENMTQEYEARKLSVVGEEILAQINHRTEGLRARREGVLEARRLMYKATHVVRDFDDVALLTLYAQEVSATEAAYGETGKELARLTRILDTPYFARLDFVEEGYGDREEIYIGRHSLFDEKNQTFHVYDWRAPISSLYYDYGVGRASFAVPVKECPRIHGEILLKRQYQIEKGKLIYFFDSDLAVEDDILRKELSKVSDAKIKTIIHSIQHEQNKAIRAEAESVLVFGPAGSGKTSVGLHRLAYLLYRHRETLSSGRVRIFSPNAIFASYIEGIIPDLGEDDVAHLDFAGLIEARSAKPFKDGYELIDHISHSPPEDPRRAWLARKYSPAFLAHLENTVRSHTPSFAEDVYFYRDKICDKARLADLYADRTTASTLAGKTARVLDYLHQCFAEYYKSNKKAITAFFESISGDDLTDEEARQRFEEERNIVVADLRNRLSPKPQKLYEKALKTWPDKASMQYIHESLRAEALCFEDALALLYVSILTGRTPPDKSVKHILLDEAQDCCPLQHRILQKLYPASHFTVLADVNQALYPDINIQKNEDIAALYPKAQIIPLTKSYRSTYEISRFAKSVLVDVSPGDADASLYMRHGEEPEIIQAPDPVQKIHEILHQLPGEYKTIGILLSDTQKARALHRQMRTSPYDHAKPIQLIDSPENRFAPGIMVMAVPFAKGLEFDAVLCPEYGQIGGRLLYLICTRALHRLYLLDTGGKG